MVAPGSGLPSSSKEKGDMFEGYSRRHPSEFLPPRVSHRTMHEQNRWTFQRTHEKSIGCSVESGRAYSGEWLEGLERQRIFAGVVLILY